MTVEQLVEALLPLGLLPQVQCRPRCEFRRLAAPKPSSTPSRQVAPEIRDFTVAGLINGLGIESSSHRYGSFVDTIAACVMLGRGDHVTLASRCPVMATLRRYEVVLGSGEVIIAAHDSPEHAELFDVLPGSYGTIGIVTAAAIKLAPAGRFVRTEYYLLPSTETYCAAMSRAIQHGEDQPDFVEGFQFSPTCGVLMLSSFTNTLPPPASARQAEAKCTFTADTVTSSTVQKVAPLQDLYGDAALPLGSPLGEELPDKAKCQEQCACFWDPTVLGRPYIHQHALELAQAGAEGRQEPPQSALFLHRLPSGTPRPGVDYMTTTDYLFRHERGWLWTLEAMVGVPALTGCTLGRKLADGVAKAAYAKLDNVMGFAGGSTNPSWTVEDMERVFVQQDTIWNMHNLAHGVEWVTQHLDLWPLWHCPCYVHPTDPTRKTVFTGAHKYPQGGFVVDMGLYGEPMAASFASRDTLRRLQLEVDFPTMFGQVYLSPAEMRQRFALDTYDEVRERYGAVEPFKTLQEKVLFYDEAKPAQGKIWAWRLKREGLLAPALGVAAVAGLTALAAGAWAAVKRADERGSALGSVGRALLQLTGKGADAAQ